MSTTKQLVRKKGTPKRTKPAKGKHYFTSLHEEAINSYVLSSDRKEKEKLYNQLIGPALSEMVEKIVYTYKFNHLSNIDDYKSECKSWLSTVLDKYDSSKGSKAFSYFTVVTKNWFIHKVKKAAKRAKVEVNLEYVNHSGLVGAGTYSANSVSNQNTRGETTSWLEDTGTESSPMCSPTKVLYQIEPAFAAKYDTSDVTYYEDRTNDEFWKSFMNEMHSWKKMDLKEGEKKVLDAVMEVFENSQDIEIFNKKAVYLYLRELTGMNTKQVVGHLNNIRSRYRTFKADWDNS